VFNDLFKNDREQAGQSFDMPENTFHEKEESTGFDGIFDLFTPETGGNSAVFNCLYCSYII
jgi:hypothetical protein